MRTRFSTRDAGPGEHLRSWRSAVDRQFLPLDIVPASSSAFEGELRRRRLGDLELVHVTAGALTAVRTADHVRRAPVDDYLLAVHLRGIAVGRQAGWRVALRPGDCALFDGAVPYTIAFGAPRQFEHMIIRIPRRELQARAPALERGLGVPVAAGTPGGSALNPLLGALWTAARAERFVEPTLDLLVAVLARAPATRGPALAPSGRQLAALKAYIAVHAAEPALSPRQVAEAHHISLRQLHRLFAGERTTFGRFLLQSRLRAAHHLLSDPAHGDLSITSVAQRCGFRSPAHFSRAFSARYGQTPSATRGRA